MHRWIEHTAELELELEADEEEALFEEAAGALAELMGEVTGPSSSREITVSAPDHATLLAEWLNELVYLADAEGLVVEHVHRLELSGLDLEAEVEARIGDPRPLVKAVTYHRLSLREQDGRWRATVVLDV